MYQRTVCRLVNEARMEWAVHCPGGDVSLVPPIVEYAVQMFEVSTDGETERQAAQAPVRFVISGASAFFYLVYTLLMVNISVFLKNQ